MPVLILFAAFLACPATSRAQDTFTGVDRIVAVGDVHGDYDQLVTVLRAAGVIDQKNRWSGGATHLVQTGDTIDRGPKSRQVLDLLMDLEKQAPKSKGRVHALIGNHEAMNIIGDERYVVAADYAAFQTRDSESLRNRAYELIADPDRKSDAAYRQQWEKEHPLGWVEHHQAFGPKGKYGAWILKHNAVVRINDVIFLHGGLSSLVASVPISEINERVRRELSEPAKLAPDALFADESGPLWYRGLARSEEQDLSSLVDGLLQFFQVRHIVIGHTILGPVIVPRFNGKVIAIDVGMSSVYGGPPACLVIEQGKLFALHRGTRIPIPEDGNVRPYLERAAALDPQPSPILKVLNDLVPGGHPAAVDDP